MVLRKSESIFFRGMGIFILVLSLYLSGCATPDSERGNSTQQLEDTEGVPLDDETISRLQAVIDRATSYAHVEGAEVDPESRGMPPIPGVVIGISVQGKQTWYGTSGFSNLETRTPIRADEIFRMGSVTKTYTGTLILQLSEEIEAFSLDDPIEKWLPGKVENGDEITVRNLLTHTSCIANYVHVKAFDDAFVANTTGRWTPEQLISIGNEAEPDCTFSPDALVLHYSNTNFILLGLLAETLTGKTLRSLFNTYIFDPLGMDNTTFLTAGDTKIPGDYVDGYFDTDDDYILEKVGTMDTSSFWAAGSVVSNVEDSIIWAKAMVGKEGNLLSDALLAERLDTSTYLPFQGDATVGMGILYRASGVIGHVGSVYGYSVYVGYYPAGETAIVVLTNRDEYLKNRSIEENFVIIMDSALSILFPEYVPYYDIGPGY